MICRRCRNCGLCPGGGGAEKKLSVAVDGILIPKLTYDSSLPKNELGIAVDIGTTTIACSAFVLATGELVSSFGEKNMQIKYGGDVVSRIAFSMTQEGLKKLQGTVVHQIEKMAERVLGEASIKFAQKRSGRPMLSRIALAGNSAMESLFAGCSCSGLSSFPFSLQSEFGCTFFAGEIFGDSSVIPNNCSVYLAPLAGPFVGGDAVCSMAACGFGIKGSKSRFLADIGTNCEICVCPAGQEKILCTSTSAGPAFEGFGIECGGPASEGSIVKVEYGGGVFSCSVFGGGTAESISGTGLLSAMAEFKRNGIVDSFGSFADESMEKIYLCGSVYITRRDVRNFQLAKASVGAGLEILSGKIPHSEKQLFLSGGFGSKLDVGDAVETAMIPVEFSSDVVFAGNTSLAGISAALLDEHFRNDLSSIKRNCTVIDLACENKFQDVFISSLNF